MATISAASARLRCPRCGKALHVNSDGFTDEQRCLNCGYADTVRAARSDRVTRPEVRRLAGDARRLLLAPSCYGRRHRRCVASGCECPCHTDQKGQP